LITATSTAIQPLKRKTVDNPVTPAERDRIALLMDRAEAYQEAGDIEQAIALWVEVLSIRVDHELALRNAAGHLWKLQYWDDARELIQRAIDAGSRVPTVYLTAIDMAERRGDAGWSAELREKVATLPTPDEALVVKVADYYVQRGDANIAQRFLEQALAAHPDMPAALIRLGDMMREAGDSIEATRLYERAARAKAPGKVRKEVDRKLRTALPVLTDRERGNVWLAAREALGVASLFLLLGWQDARLDLLALGPRRWLGVLVSLAGGYLLVTATSSPQQKPLAGWLGGTVPPPSPPPPPRGPLDPEPFRPPGRALQEPTELPLLPASVRLTLALAGLVLLVLAFVLVFSQSLEWVGDHRPPYLPW
jgi:Tfp pilus assembly protein PilF